MAVAQDLIHIQEDTICDAPSCESESDSDESLSEQMVENEDGDKELILVATSSETPRLAGAESDSVTVDDLEGCGYSNFFRNCVSLLMKEKIIQCSPRGKKALGLLHHLVHMDQEQLADISSYIVDRINSCIPAGTVLLANQKLMSSLQGHMWSAFHQLRCDGEVCKVWEEFIARSSCQEECQESQLVLQLIIDRILKKLLENKANTKRRCKKSEFVAPLTSLECNGIRYMAGYIAVKLLRKYQKPTKNPQLKIKHQYFVQVLERMKAKEDLLANVDSLSEYTSLWTELIDRGGLYHISDQVFQLIHAIELIVRRYFNINTAQTEPDSHLKKQILGAVLCCDDVQRHWETVVAGSIPQKYEKYSVCLLHVITELWINVRGHSFAQGWTMNFERKYKKGTRKTLQPQREN